MAKIYESLKNLVTSDMVNKAAETLGESKGKVSSAISIILPSLLAKLHKKGSNPQIDAIVKDAGMADLLSKKTELFQGHGIVDNANYGERFENAVLGQKDNDFMSAVASFSGMKASNVDRLINWVAGLTTGYFGERVVKGNSTMSGLMGELENEKKQIMSEIPSDVSRKLGFSEGKKKNNWWIWVVLIILLLLIFFWWRSCNRQSTNSVSNRIIERADTVRQNISDNISNDRANSMQQAMTQLTLPNGEVISVCKDGCEGQIVAFLNSDKYKNASASDLRDTWFEFDNIDFKHDSATEFMPGAEAQLNNLVAILKNYPDVKIRIGGFADNTGGEAVNMEISEERANHIKSIFVQNGIDANRVSTEGFGKEFATRPASAPDSERAGDRILALRFEK